MPAEKLLIIHQGALGDIILTFPAIIRLQKYYDPIDVLCQSGIGKLTKALGLVEAWYPLEAAYVSSLFTDQIDSKIKKILKPYTHIILFTLSDQLEQTIHHLTSASLCCMSPKPPENVRLHLTEYVMENLVNCRLIKRADAAFEDILLPSPTSKLINRNRILLHPGAGSCRKRWPMKYFFEIEAILKSDGLKPAFILGPAEEDLIDRLQHPDRTVHTLTDLLDLMDLLKSAGGYIGNDSGGQSPGSIFRLAGGGGIRPYGSETMAAWETQCRPCFETEKANCDDPECLTKTTPRDVIRAFYRKYRPRH